jgi:CRISPR/Cas system-associated exonuclease Cas4 (RecB family)
MEAIRNPLVKYTEITKQLNEVNAKAKELREERQSVELDLTAAYAENNSLPDKIELKQSKMMFTVKKPGEWKKGWSLSKKQLQDYLLEILPEHGEDVMREIIRRHEPKLTTTDWAFELKTISEE